MASITGQTLDVSISRISCNVLILDCDVMVCSFVYLPFCLVLYTSCRNPWQVKQVWTSINSSGNRFAYSVRNSCYCVSNMHVVQMRNPYSVLTTYRI